MFSRLFLVIAFCFWAGIAWADDRAAFVGMQIQGMAEDLAQALGREKAAGVLVRDVALGGPAARAGFRRGDLIVRFNEAEVESFQSLINMVGRLKAGDEVPVVVARKGGEVGLKLRTTPWPEAWRVDRGEVTAVPELGATFAALTPKIRETFGLRWGSIGVVVSLTTPETPAGKALRRGEVVVQVNQEDVWSPKRVSEIVAQAGKSGRNSVLLLVEGPDGFRYVLLPFR